MVTLFLLLLFQSADESIELVKKQFLDLDKSASVGQAFDSYPFFESTQWRLEGSDMVVFEGIMDDATVTAAYQADHQWSWRENFKAMQLKSIYQLDDDKDKLAFIFYFQLDGRGGFKVDHGFLGVRSLKNGQWRQVALGTRPIVKIMSGLYSKQNPYLSLIQGLPFK